MILISGIMTIDPANAARMLELTTVLSDATRQESGNIAYEYWQDPADAGRWRVFEEWEDEDALNSHMASAHMAAFLGAAGELGFAGVDISRYDGAEKKKFM